MSALLEINNISHRFGGLHVLRGVNFEVPKGAITGLIGPNGAGKSTLFNIVSGFLTPSDGKIFYAGKDVTRQSIQQRSQQGLLRSFQTPQVFKDLTVWENMIAGCHMRGRTGIVEALFALPAVWRERIDAETAAARVIEEFNLAGIRDQLAGELPAGKQRMVELARAVVAAPVLLCLDEPSSGLSAEEVKELMASLRRLKEKGITILLVSHDMELMAVSDNIHALCFGEIIASGNLAHMQANSRVREAYLGV